MVPAALRNWGAGDRAFLVLWLVVLSSNGGTGPEGLGFKTTPKGSRSLSFCKSKACCQPVLAGYSLAF